MRQKRKAREKQQQELAAEQAAAQGDDESTPGDADAPDAELGADAGAQAEAIADGEADDDGDVEVAADADAPPANANEDSGSDEIADPDRLTNIVESLLFASDKPLDIKMLRSMTGQRDLGKLKAAVDVITDKYMESGIVVHEVAGGWQFRTNPANSRFVSRLISGRPVRLTRAQLETLAIVAYRQPITRPEIDDIRGVDSGGTLKILLDRSLVRVLGKKEEPGRPLLYGTSKDFLEFFNLNDLRDLPTLREYQELTEDSLRQVEALGDGFADDAEATETETDTETAAETETAVEIDAEHESDSDRELEIAEPA